MKSREFPLVIYLFVGALVLGPLAARAGHDEEEGDPRFRLMDTNGDGHVSRAEYVAGSRGLFAAMDADHDGQVTAAEMDTSRAQRKDAAIRFSAANDADATTRSLGSGAARADGSVSSHEVANARTAAPAELPSVAQIRLMDANRDGRLSLAEYEADSIARFSRLDADHDGRLSRTECPTVPEGAGK